MSGNSKAFVIEKAKWDSLPERDQLLLKKIWGAVTVKEPPPPKTLGSKNPVTRERKLSIAHSAPKEYFTRIRSVCECCDGVVIKEGKMTLLNPKDKSLSFVEQEVPSGEVMKQKSLYPVNCVKCKERLFERDKEDLVAKIMHLTKIAVMRGWI